MTSFDKVWVQRLPSGRCCKCIGSASGSFFHHGFAVAVTLIRVDEELR